MGDWALVDVHAERETSLRHVSQLQFFLATPLLPLQLSLTHFSLPRFSFNYLTTRIRSPHMGRSAMNHLDQMSKSSICILVIHTTVGHCTKQCGQPNTPPERIQECVSAHIAQEIGSDGWIVTKVTWEHAVAGISCHGHQTMVHSREITAASGAKTRVLIQ